MKGNHEFEYDFLRDGHGKINFNNGAYLYHPPTRVIPKYESKSHFLFDIATVKLQSGEVVGNWLKVDWEAHVDFEINQAKKEGAEKMWLDKVACEEGQL
eukprot:9316222-Ditylum_brightwellii.AAC.2